MGFKNLVLIGFFLVIFSAIAFVAIEAGASVFWTQQIFVGVITIAFVSLAKAKNKITEITCLKKNLLMSVIIAAMLEGVALAIKNISMQSAQIFEWEAPLVVLLVMLITWWYSNSYHQKTKTNTV